MAASPQSARPIRVCWVANEEDEASYVDAAHLPDVPPLNVEWTRILPALEDVARYDLLVVDPGAIRLAPDELERRVHAELPSLPIVFVSGLAARHHIRASGGLHFAIPSLTDWIAHEDYSLTEGLPRRLAQIASDDPAPPDAT